MDTFLTITNGTHKKLAFSNDITSYFFYIISFGYNYTSQTYQYTRIAHVFYNNYYNKSSYLNITDMEMFL